MTTAVEAAPYCEDLQQELVSLRDTAQAITVSTAAEYDAAIAKIKEIRERRKRWQAYWKPLLDAAHRQHKALKEREKEGSLICDQAERALNAAAFQFAEQARALAEQERLRLQAIEDERVRKEQERLEKQAAKLKTPEKQAAKMEQAASITATTVAVPVATPQVEGTHTRSTWKIGSIDLSALIKSAAADTTLHGFLQADETAIRKVMLATNGTLRIPGVTFVRDTKLVVRT